MSWTSFVRLHSRFNLILGTSLVADGFMQDHVCCMQFSTSDAHFLEIWRNSSSSVSCPVPLAPPLVRTSPPRCLICSDTVTLVRQWLCLSSVPTSAPQSAVRSAKLWPKISASDGGIISSNNAIFGCTNFSIIIGCAFAVVLALLPETQPSVVIANAAAGDPLADKIRQRKSSLDAAKEMYFIASEALKILFTEPIVAFLGVFNGFAYGLLFLYLDVTLFIILEKSDGRVSLMSSPSITD